MTDIEIYGTIIAKDSGIVVQKNCVVKRGGAWKYESLFVFTDYSLLNAAIKKCQVCEWLNSSLDSGDFVQ